jgi:holin-like protein
MVRGLAILCLLQGLGELTSTGLNLPIPGNVLGMGLLLLALNLKLINPAWVEEAVEFLLAHLALFFVPAGVGVMVYFHLLAAEWLPILVATVVSTFVVMAVTGWVSGFLEQRSVPHDS